jgi:hypothetical protein
VPFFTARLVDRLLDGTTATGNPPQDLLKQLLQEFPGLTVNRIDNRLDAT